MVPFLLRVACFLTCSIELSAARTTFSCGIAWKQCTPLFLECQPGESIEINSAYYVKSEASLGCIENLMGCNSTYKSKCCSEVTVNDSIVNFTTSAINNIRNQCDNKQKCSDFILVLPGNLQAVQYQCNTDGSTLYSTTSPYTRTPLSDDYNIAIPISGTVGICLFVVVGTFITLWVCKTRMRSIPGSQMEEAIYVNEHDGNIQGEAINVNGLAGNIQGEERAEHYISVF